jgi:hypothetical protein
MNRVLTGNYYFKPTIVGLVLTVEAEYRDADKSNSEPSDYTLFEKATTGDLFELGLISSAKHKTE